MPKLKKLYHMCIYILHVLHTKIDQSMLIKKNICENAFKKF